MRSGDDSKRRRTLRRVLVAGCLLLLLAVVGGLPVYVRPQLDPLRHADAILIIGGIGAERYPYGIGLAEQGWAPNLLVSNPKGRADRWLTNRCASPPPGVAMHCFVPDPPTTRGEGQELRRWASEYGWRTIIVVTFRPHISRARFILQQCFDGDLVMVASPAQISIPSWAFEYAYQTAGYVRAVLQPGC